MVTKDRLRIGDTDYNVVFYDTETHADDELSARIADAYAHGVRPLPSEGVGVWLWYCVSHSSGDFRASPHGQSMDSFRQYLKHGTDRGNRMVYVFNLAFEVSYILPWLLSHGFRYGTERGADSFDMVSNESRSSVYQLTVRFKEGLGIAVFKDLHKMRPGGSLREMAKEYDLPIKKSYISGKDDGGEGYRKMRRIPGYVPTDEELYYCWADCKVCEELFSIKVDEYNDMLKRYPTTEIRKNGRKRAVPTEQTDRFKEFFIASSSASYACRRMVDETFPDRWDVSKKGRARHVTPIKQFRDRFPKLGEAETDFARQSYEGGLCYPTAWVRGKDLGDTKIGHADVVSQYPSQIICRAKFPYGYGTFFYGDDYLSDDTHMSLLKIAYAYDGVNRIPSLKRTGVCGIWYSDFDGMDRDPNARYVPGEIPPFLYVWDFYLDTLRRCLKGFRYKVLEGYTYKAAKSPFAPYFLRHFNLKNEYKRMHLPAKKMNEKYLINQPTGKFGEKPHNDRRKCVLDGMGYPSMVVDGVESEDTCARYTYVPFISAVTAYAREFLLRTADLIGFANICYRDTDSLRFFLNKDTKAVVEGRPDYFGGELMHFEVDKEPWVHCLFAKPKSYRYEVLGTGEKGIKTGGFHAPDYDELKDVLTGNPDGSPYFADRMRMVDTPKGKVRIDTKHAFYNRPW